MDGDRWYGTITYHVHADDADEQVCDDRVFNDYNGVYLQPTEKEKHGRGWWQ
jgi:hypothetical protein